MISEGVPVSKRATPAFDLTAIQAAIAERDKYRSALEYIEYEAIGICQSYDRIVNKWDANMGLTNEDINRLIGIIKEIQGVCIRQLA